MQNKKEELFFSKTCIYRTMKKVLFILFKSFLSILIKTKFSYQIIINLGIINHFFANKNLITIYKKHQHLFEMKSRKKVTAQNYRKVILQPQLLDGIVYTITIHNINWAHNIEYNVLNTLFLTKKRKKIFLKKTGQSSKIYFENEIIIISDMIDN